MVRGLPIAAAPPIAEHGLQARGFSSCGTWAKLHGMWDLPGPGPEPVSPALAGGFLTTVPPGKSLAVCPFKGNWFIGQLPSLDLNWEICLPTVCSH